MSDVRAGPRRLAARIDCDGVFVIALGGVGTDAGGGGAHVERAEVAVGAVLRDVHAVAGDGVARVRRAGVLIVAVLGGAASARAIGALGVDGAGLPVVT